MTRKMLLEREEQLSGLSVKCVRAARYLQYSLITKSCRGRITLLRMILGRSPDLKIICKYSIVELMCINQRNPCRRGLTLAHFLRQFLDTAGVLRAESS